MGWNGSDRINGAGAKLGQRAPAKRSGTKGSGLFFGLLAGLAVIVFVGMAAWLILGKSEVPASPEESDKRDKRSIPDFERPATPEKPAASDVQQPKKPELKTYVDERGITRYEGGLRVPKKIVQPPQDQMNYNGPHLFANTAEHEILGLMTTEPGTFMIDVKYDKRTFEKAFLESLDHPIEILPDDPPEIQDQKLAVIDAKKTLEAAYRRGEDVTEIMNETRKELVKLNRYRDSLLEIASADLSKDGTTDKDLDDYVDAMNAMLRDNGIREIQHRELARNVLRYQRNAAAKKAAEQGQ